MSDKEQIPKNIMISILSDAAGTGMIRNFFPTSYITSVFMGANILKPIITPLPIFDENILMQTKVIHFQRYMNMHGVSIVEAYKRARPKFGYKMTYDIDDWIWQDHDKHNKQALPEWSFCAKNIKTEQHDASIMIMNMMDEVCCSTQYIADELVKLGVNTKITVWPNVVNQYFYGKVKRQITQPLKKPKVLYTGSPTHYNNEEKLYGDWFGSEESGPSFVNWIKKNVKENKIDFMVLGGLPWFFEEIKDKIKVIDWMNSYQYHVPLMAWKPDIGIAPLISNRFNYAKSNIKHLEYCALNCASIGTTFLNGNPSPYDDNILKVPENVTVAELDELLEKLKQPEYFNSVIMDQHKYLESNGLWLESKKNVDRLYKIFGQ